MDVVNGCLVTNPWGLRFHPMRWDEKFPICSQSGTQNDACTTISTYVQLAIKINKVYGTDRIQSRQEPPCGRKSFLPTLYKQLSVPARSQPLIDRCLLQTERRRWRQIVPNMVRLVVLDNVQIKEDADARELPRVVCIQRYGTNFGWHSSPGHWSTIQIKWGGLLVPLWGDNAVCYEFAFYRQIIFSIWYRGRSFAQTSEPHFVHLFCSLYMAICLIAFTGSPWALDFRVGRSAEISVADASKSLLITNTLSWSEYG